MLKLLIALLRWSGRHAKKAALSPGAIQAVVICEVTRLGDSIAILPSLRKLRSDFPDAQVHVLVDEAYGPLLSACVPDVHILGVRTPRSPGAMIRTAATVRRLRPDLACSMSPSARNAFLALASGARFVAGYLEGRGSLAPFLRSTPVECRGFRSGREVQFGRENIEQRAWKVVEALGLNETGERAFEAHRQAAGRDLIERCAPVPGSPGERRIVIHPFSGWVHRSWPAASFVGLTRGLLARLPHSISIIAHASEEDLLRPFQAAFGDDARVSILALSDIMKTASILLGAELFVGNDSGPLHLAALLGIPVVGLYGPAPPDLTAPLSARGTFLYRKVDCAPCAQLRCVMPEHSCMRKISADDVMAAVETELGCARREEAVAHG